MERIIPVQRELGSRAVEPELNSWLYQDMLLTEWQWRGNRNGVYALFQEMEERDAHLFSTLQTRKNALAGCDWKMVPADSTEEAQRIARDVEDALHALPDFSGVVFKMMDAVAKGISILELMWRVDPQTGRVAIDEVKSRFPSAFLLDNKGQLHLASDNLSHTVLDETPRLLARPGESALMLPRTRMLPERKFLRFIFQQSPSAPYGSPLCAKSYSYYFIKKNTLKFWTLFNEKFGVPTVAARYTSATSAEELDTLSEALAILDKSAAILVPETVTLDLLEAKRSGAANTYRELADWCNDEISKIVLGQTLTTSEGRRSGSLALGRVHEQVRSEYLQADARAVGEALSSQLVRWIVDFNHGIDVAAPRFVFDVANAGEFRDDLAIDQELIRMGVALPASYFYEKYRRPAPEATERALRYDDANLYQYHLQFGVLTINEVRAALGLAPVEWGNTPPRNTGATTGDPALPRDHSGTEGTPQDEQTKDRRKR